MLRKTIPNGMSTFKQKDQSAAAISLLFIILAELQISRVFGDRGILLHEVILALLFSEFGFKVGWNLPAAKGIDVPADPN